MRVLVVGATGVVGSPLVRALSAEGHSVVATSRNPKGMALPEVTVKALDLLDPAATSRLVADTKPDVVIHQATALTGLGNNVRRFDAAFATTNRLRVEGTTALIEAGRRMSTPPRLVVQSFCGWPWAPEGGPVKSENDPLDPHPAPAFQRTFAALVEMERLVTGYENGTIVRYGALYGAGTSLGPGGDQIEAIRKRAFPLIGDSDAVWSFLHVEDAADAAIAAMHGPRGVYNIADDTPVRLGEWLVEVARMLGAPEPRRVPVWLARLVGGQGLVHMMTTARGSANAKAKAELGWEPRHSDWREGFSAMLASASANRDR